MTLSHTQRLLQQSRATRTLATDQQRRTTDLLLACQSTIAESRALADTVRMLREQLAPRPPK